MNDNFPDGTPAWFRGEDDELEDGDHPFECNSGACFDPACATCGPHIKAIEARAREAALEEAAKLCEREGAACDHHARAFTGYKERMSVKNAHTMAGNQSRACAHYIRSLAKDKAG